MRRRTFITLLGGAAVWPLAARGQNGKGTVRLGFLPLGSPSNAYDRSLVRRSSKVCAALASSSIGTLSSMSRRSAETRIKR
jgi:hypothetical protein